MAKKTLFRYKKKMKAITLFSLLLLSLSTHAKTRLVTISKSVIINKDITSVFDHVKNTLNDDTWRKEVNHMSADGPFQIGTTYTEDAHIGFQKHFITKTVLVGLKDLDHALYITPKNAKYYLSSLREVKSLGPHRTKFTYTVKFDQRMSKVTLGVSTPRPLLVIGYGVIMSQYLNKLKRHLE